jgi:hypothetical protein
LTALFQQLSGATIAQPLAAGVGSSESVMNVLLRPRR